MIHVCKTWVRLVPSSSVKMEKVKPHGAGGIFGSLSVALLEPNEPERVFIKNS